VKELGLPVMNYGIVTDDPEMIREKILMVLSNHDVLLISGGVSAGDYDFVPDILKETGMDIKFHKMKVRPGKPLLLQHSRRCWEHPIMLPAHLIPS